MPKVGYFKSFERGTIGNVTYRQVGQDVIASQKSSLNPDRVKNSKEFVNTRKRNMEFKGTAMATTHLMNSLKGMEKDVPGANKLRNWVRKKMEVILKHDMNGVYGERGVLISENSSELINKTWGRNSPEMSIREAPKLTVGEGKQVTLSFKGLSPKSINAPKGSTDTKLYALMYAVSDYVYDSDARGYAALNEEAEGWSQLVESDYISHTGTLESPIELTLKPDVASTENVTFFVALGVDHFVKVGREYTMLKELMGYRTILSV